MFSRKSFLATSVLILGLLILLVALFLIFGNQVNLIRPSGGAYMGQVAYEKVPNYVGQYITLEGYVIIPITSRACGGLAWATCKLWLDNDPYEPGLGLHELLVPIGTSRNSVTSDGKLYDTYGQLLPLTVTKQFNWYHIMVTGQVAHCKDTKCLIAAESIIGIR
ncbi:MAG: hypothetical protein HPY45_01260 [Anaerolineae bacterium]|nr:hypothetical protein [Anaerolineae bacterium]